MTDISHTTNPSAKSEDAAPRRARRTSGAQRFNFGDRVRLKKDNLFPHWGRKGECGIILAVDDTSSCVKFDVSGPWWAENQNLRRQRRASS